MKLIVLRIVKGVAGPEFCAPSVLETENLEQALERLGGGSRWSRVYTARDSGFASAFPMGELPVGSTDDIEAELAEDDGVRVIFSDQQNMFAIFPYKEF